tara:strand:+ start:1268 stop:1771 length:504 start_codon:yes stop_codon:yes gene_type:complete
MAISRSNMSKQIKSGKMKKKVVKKKSGSKVLGSISPLYGMISGEGAFGKLASAGFSPAGMLAKQQKKKKQMRAQEAVPVAKNGGSMMSTGDDAKDLSIVRMGKGGSPKKKSKSRVNEAGNYTDPAKRKRIFNRIKAGGKGGAPGQWSARKAQMMAKAYKKAGGGYRD